MARTGGVGLAGGGGRRWGCREGCGGAYETDGAIARRSTVEKLAAALNVSVKFLTDENCMEPLADIEKDTYIEQARALHGAQGARDMEELLNETKALFAGGTISEEQKDAYFQAVMAAYLACKEEAKKKYGRNSEKS
ncbi:MAG: XRE family transcriptional regulator [Oscillibacter sp.]|nr:XRE family transcriptional regulator [Oscillibacter sp.]